MPFAALLLSAACGGAFGGSVFGDASAGGGSGGGGSQEESALSSTRTEVATITTTSGWGTIYSFQPKVFFASDLYWLFYTEASNHVYVTSSDGIDWGDKATAVSPFAETSGHRVSYYHDGTYLHVVHGAGTTGSGTVFYRRGTLETDGSITWSSTTQTVFNDSGKGGAYVTVWADSNGYPWIGTMYYTDPAYGNPKIAKVYKSSANDGSWTTDTGFPKELYESDTDILTVPLCVPLTSGKVYCGWSQETYPDVPFRGQLWDGDSWGDAEDMTTSFGSFTHFTLEAEDDAVHLAFYDGANEKVKYRKRSAAGSWGSEVELDAMPVEEFINLPVVRVTGEDTVRVHWSRDHIIYFRDVVAGSAGVLTELRDERVDGLVDQNPVQVVSPLSDTSSYLLAYSTGTSAYKVVSLLVEE